MRSVFVVTPQHLALLRRANVRWVGSIEYGAPAIDPKRPYGNGDVESDIREILQAGLTDEECRTLHEETTTALQIALSTGSFDVGPYASEPYSRKWERAS